MWQRIALWREGKPEARWDRIPERLKFLVRHGLLQGRILTQRYPGVMHALMFWGFCALLLGTILATIDYDITLRLPLGLDFKLLQGPFYLVYELSLDLFGLFFVVGLGLALYRRFVVRPARIDPTPSLRVAPGASLRHQRDRLRARGVSPGGRRSPGGRPGRRSAGRSGSSSWRSG